MDFIKKSAKDCLISIKEHKILFSIALVLQVLIFILLAYISISYPQKIFSDIEGISVPMQTANYNATSIEAGIPFSSDMGLVYKSYESLIGHLQELVLWGLGIFLLLEAAMWILMQRMFISENKNIMEWIMFIGKSWLKYLVSAMIWILFPIMVIALITKTMMMTGMEEQAVSMISIVFGILMVFMYLFINMIAHINTESWKAFVKSFFKTLIMKGIYTFLTFIISLLLLAATIALIVLGMSYQSVSLIIIPLSILLLIEIVIVRLFWIASLHNLTKEEHREEYKEHKREQEHHENHHN